MILHPRRLRQIFFDLRTEASGRGRDAVALGVGVLIGCSPFYGFHLLLVWFVGWLLHLNRFKMYLAANISNPLFSPLLVLSELQTGAWVRGHDLYDLSLETIRTTHVWMYALDLVLGSAIVGTILGLAVAGVTYATAGGDDPFAALWERASEPYLPLSITAWEFARGKLRGDPVYRAALRTDLIGNGGTLVDIGCGQGLTLSMLLHAARLQSEGTWPKGEPNPPRFDRMVGVELRPRIARLASRALGSCVDIRIGDALELMPSHADTILLFDVLHLMPPASQEEVIARAADALSATGTLVIREADPAGGWRFVAVRVGNWLKSLAVGHPRQQFHFRDVDEWVSLLRRHGLQVDVTPADKGTPFANLLVHGVVALASRPALHDSTDVDNRRLRRAGQGLELPPEPKPTGHM